jgi:predicted nucleotidyltransferase
MGTKLENALATLRAAESQLRARGIQHAGIFGSIARGEAKPQSDIDVLVDLDPMLPITIYDYVGIQEEVARLFSQPVDVIDSAGLRPRMRTVVTRDLVYAF